MKKFTFSLQKVLDYKQQILDLLKNELASLQAQHREIENKISDANREFQVTNLDLVSKLAGGVSSYDISIYKGYLNTINQRILALEAEKQKLSDTVAAKQQEIIHMNGDISGLEHLKDRQLHEYHSLERKEQEMLVEEFVSHSANHSCVKALV